MAEESKPEDYPQEIDEQLASFGSSVSSVRTMLEQLMSMPRNELLKLEPLDQAKLDLMSAYTLNSLFWMYLVTQGVNPRDHGIKQELERIRTYMNKVKEITDRKKMARLDKDAAGRFLKSALYNPKEKDFTRKAPQEAPHRTPHGAPYRTALGTPLGAPHRAPHGTPSGASKSKRPKRS